MTSPDGTAPDIEEQVGETVDDEATEDVVEPQAEPAADEAPVDETPDVAPADGDAPEGAPTDAQVAELTEALQRERAQFANFRRRSAEEQLQSVARGKQVLVEKLLPILDDLDRAAEHGDLVDGSPLKALAGKLGDVLAGEQLAKFGAPGDVFDPEIHEAIQNDSTGDEHVLGLVYRAGYRLGEKVIRTAMVTVTDPSGE